MIQLFLDTNIFVQFRRFEEIDWPAIAGTEAVVLVVAQVVVRELEKHKASTNKRLSRRAASVLKNINHVIGNGVRGNVREGVELVVSDAEPAINFAAARLSPDLPDDVLLACVIEAGSGSEVALVTADTGPTIKARGRTLRVITLSDDLRLPAEEDPDAKELRDLRRQVEQMRSARPELRVGFRDERDFFEVDYVRHRVKTDDEIRGEIEKMRSGACDGKGYKAWGGAYEKEYDSYLQKIAEHLAARERNSVAQGLTATLNLWLFNTGTAEATNIDLFLFFPLDLSLQVTADRAPKPPTEPSMPFFKKPGFGLKVAAPKDPVVNVVLNQPPRDPNVVVQRHDEYFEVRLRTSNLKHGMRQAFAPLDVTFGSFDDVRSLEIRYALVVGNLPENLEGILRVVARSDQELPSRTRPATQAANSET